MRTLIRVLMLFILSACASQPFVDARLAPYLKTGAAPDTTVMFGDFRNAAPAEFGDVRAAECQRFAFENLVTVNEIVWAGLSEEQRRWLLAHELGHCERGLAHTYELDRRGCPVGVMYPSVPKKECL